LLKQPLGLYLGGISRKDHQFSSNTALGPAIYHILQANLNLSCIPPIFDGILQAILTFMQYPTYL
jgi:hypothetical protein